MNEERIMKLESGLKKLNNKFDHKQNALISETSSEFQSMRRQFEEYGESLYIRLFNEFNDALQAQINKFANDF